MTCAHKYYHASIWPYPYICDDRADVQRVCQGQIANGWAAETTFYDYHFDQFSHELNSAGREKVAWIVSSAPPQFRQAYLAPSRLDQSVDDRRMASMQKESARISDGALQVSARVALPDGRPAHEVQSIFEFRRENPIPPKITYAGVGSAGK